MGRKAAYTVEIHDGREIGFGLVKRGGETFSVQFKDVDGTKYIFRATGKRARPKAIARAEQIVKDHYAPPGTLSNQSDWDTVIKELRRHLEKTNKRADTIADYTDTLNQVRGAADRPAALSADHAQLWCNKYLTGTYKRGKGDDAKEYRRSPSTLHARVRKLSAIWNKYMMRRLKVAEANPWEAVDLPKVNQKPVRTLTPEQVNEFFAWLEARWRGWELPSLFFEVKAVTGCRLGDLAAARSEGLVVVKDGDKERHLITFNADTRKERQARVGVLDADLFEKVKALAGKTYVWESYATDIRKYLELRGVPTHRTNPEFSPDRLVWWAKDEVDDFNKSRPDKPKIQSHDFRKRFITEAHKEGSDVDNAAAAAGMTPATARAYYHALDQEAAAASVSSKIGSKLRPKKEEPKKGRPAEGGQPMSAAELVAKGIKTIEDVQRLNRALLGPAPAEAKGQQGADPKLNSKATTLVSRLLKYPPGSTDWNAVEGQLKSLFKAA